MGLAILFSNEFKGMGMQDKEKDVEKPEGLSLIAGLYCVATPIGNLRDITMRALDVLRSADLVLCEDTRVTRKLMSAYQISAKLQVYNDHSGQGIRKKVVEMIAQGKVLALVSDAGLPLISDPGYKLVRDVQDTGHYVTTIPGASATLSALQISGVPSDKFCFLGFLPPKALARQKVLSEWVGVQATLIAFETAPRLKASLKDIGEVLGAREIAVVREITKKFEEVKRDEPEELLRYYEENGNPKGEIVLVIAPPREEAVSEEDVDAMLREALRSMKVKDAAKFVAEKTGRKKSEIYDMGLHLIKGHKDQ